MQTKKLLIVTHCFPADEKDLVGNFLYEFIKYLSETDYEVTVFTPRMDVEYDLGYQKKYAKNIELFSWAGGDKRLAEFKTSNLKDLRSLFSLFRNGKKQLEILLKKKKFDFILAPWVIPSGYIVSKIAKKNKIPFGVWALGSDINVYGKKPLISGLIRKILKKSDLVFTNNFQMQKMINEKYKVDPTILFTNRKLSKPSSSNKLNSSYKKTPQFKILFIGRLEFVKGPDILLEALLGSDIKDYSLKFIGDGSMRNELELFVNSNKLENKVSFLGQQGKDIIAEELIHADYLVISSRSEGMPVVFWEAMQMNTPVLSTNCGDIQYYCKKYNVGRVSDISSGSLGELLNFAYNFKPLRETLSKSTEKLASLTDIKSSTDKFDKIITAKFLNPKK
ncbi:MAG: glycosyltransferase [Candidatus Delongbacteria bacterium]|jgi:glycosyltransferase involved in cell wall biosynthesis|nr:glycosyltransferase [Candidatus Delongbacteria bacterium]